MKHCGLFILFACGLSFAQESTQYQACSKQANTQHEMHACANEEAKRVDDELNRVYKFLLSKVRNDSVATTKIKVAQKAWEAYRDAYTEAMYPAKDKQSEYGTSFPMEVDLLSAKLSRQQINALHDLVEQHQTQ